MTEDIDEHAARVETLFERAVEAKRVDLNSLEPHTREILEILRNGYCVALNNAPENAGRAYFDFMDDTTVDAVAARRFGFSFIGVSTGLVYAILGRASHIRQSEMTRALVDLRRPQLEGVADVILHLVLTFVVLHEQGHHRFGHTGILATRDAVREFGAHTGSDPTEQAEEVICDGWAVHNLSETLIGGPVCPLFVRILKLESNSEEDIDHILFSLMVMLGVAGIELLMA